MTQKEFGNPLDIVLGTGLGDAQIITDIVAAGSEPKRPAIIKDGLAEPVLLETGVGEVVVEFHGEETLREQLLVGLGRSRKIAVDIGRIGPVPQRIGTRRRKRIVADTLRNGSDLLLRKLLLRGRGENPGPEGERHHIYNYNNPFHKPTV